MTDTPSYRPDIDGLRAIAVLSVVFYHFDVLAFGGGFVGVDVFFVISGYLITQIIHRDVRAGTFTLLGFYDRRFRRILPAMLAMLACTLVAAHLLLFPSDYERLGEQVAYSAFGLANFYFLWNTGYFDPAAEMLPLLHMWSLAVEEQFYLLWPVVLSALVGLARTSRKVVIGVLAAIVMASLACAVYLVANDPKQAFFLPHARAWELALGAALVFAPAIRDARVAEGTGAVGLALVLGSALLLNERHPFPGLNALFPCLGAAALVWPKAVDTRVGRALSARPAVAVGLISYSLYLWHWPMLVFFRYYANGSNPTKLETIALVAAALAVSALSWRFIERPFRQPRWSPSRAVSAGLLVISCAAASGLAVHASAGAPWRLDLERQRIAAYLNYQRPAGPDTAACNFSSRDIRAEAPCFAGDPAKPNVLLVGDSHAGHFIAAMRAAFPEAHISRITDSGCRPVLHSTGDADCVALMKRVYDDIVPNHEFDAVVLSARWRNGQADRVPESVRYLARFTPKVIVFGQTMEYREKLPALLAHGALLRRDEPMSRFSMFAAAKRIDETLRAGLQGGEAQYFSVLDAICPEGRCLTTVRDNIPASRDRAHLTFEAAAFVLEKFKADGLSF